MNAKDFLNPVHLAKRNMTREEKLNAIAAKCNDLSRLI